MSNDQPSDLSEIWEIIDAADEANVVSIRTKLLSQAVEQLTSLVDSGIMEALYPLGYAYYCFPKSEASARGDAVSCFQKALALGIESSLSRLYLGYCNFDSDNFERCLEYLEPLTANDFTESMWIRVRELKLCSFIMIYGISDSCSEIIDCADFVSNLAIPDVPPLLLINTIESSIEKGDSPEILRYALDRLDSAYPIMSGSRFSQMLCKRPTEPL